VTATRTRAYARAALAYAAVVTALLLWPYRFSWPADVPNGVRWLPGGGVEWQAPGLIRSAGSARALIASLADGAGFSVELWLASARPDQTGPARIVGSSRDVDHRNFTLGQERDALIVRLRTDRTNANGTPPLRVPGVFADSRLRHVLASYELASGTLRVWVDGALAAESRAPGGSLAPWDPGMPLWLGNEATGTRPWLGRLRLLALYAQAQGGDLAARHFAAGPPVPGAPPVSDPAAAPAALYRFDAGAGALVADQSSGAAPVDLEIPAGFRVGERQLLAVHDSAGSLDRFLNLLLLLPFGFLLDRALGGLRPGRRTACVLAVAAAFPLLMEALQYGLPPRISSAQDALLNALGACIGLAWSRVQGRRAAP